MLNYGALPLTFTKESVQSISPSLGSAQLHAGLIAGAIGLLLVVLYCLLYYRGLAVVAVSSLIIAGVLVFEAVVLLGKYQDFALQLSGVAGLIVAIGITADSFVVFFERLRDEVRDGPDPADRGGTGLETGPAHGAGLRHRLVPGRGAAVVLLRSARSRASRSLSA